MTVLRRAARHAFVATAITLVLACDDDPTGNTDSIEISVTPASASLAHTSPTFVNVTVTRSSGYTGTVTIAVSGLPNGVSATMDPSDLPSGTTTARIDLTASAGAAAGNATVTVSASAPDVDPVTATFTLTVTTYSLAVEPVALTIAAGSSGTADVSISRQGYTGAVHLALAGAPAGVVGAFDPAAPTTGSSVLTITVGSSVNPGNYALTVTEANDPGVRIAALQLTVLAAPGGSSNVEYRYCDPAQAPAFFAFQDGGGSWQAVPGTSSGGVTRFAFDISSGRGGMMAVFQSTSAFAVRSPALRLTSRYATSRSARSFPLVARRRAANAAAVGDEYSTIVLYGTTAELAADGEATCAATLPTRTARTTVRGLIAGQYAVTSLGSATVYLDAGLGEFDPVFEDVQTGLVDFVGARIVTPGQAPDRLLLFRNLDPVDGGPLPVNVDFGSASAFAPATATVAISGSGVDDLEVYNEVVTKTSWLLLWSDLVPSTNASRPWIGLNAANVLPTDLHGLIVFASSAQAEEDFRVASKYVGPVANQAISIGPEVNAATTSELASGNYPRYRFNGVVPDEYNKGVAISILPEVNGNDFLVMVARGYLAAAGNAQSYDLSMPDALAIPGFPAAARLSPGTNFVMTDAFGFSGTGVFDFKPVAGTEFRASVRLTPLVVP
jgi:hypothetical protein